MWAPSAGRVAALVNGGVLRLEPVGEGVFEGECDAAAGDDYHLVVDGGVSLPDPCSRSQPEGVLGPSRIVDPGAFAWTDDGWEGLEPRDLVLYELHVGTFSRAGTFAGAIERLGELRELGVTAIELMPVATFPGARNWGYDGLYTWAPHPSYGGPEGLVALIDAAHGHGLGVLVDVVYNHIGPGSQALEVFGPYLTHDYATPWGTAVNFDGRDSGGVREWAIQNACMWVRDYHADGLRVDAVHAMRDLGARHVMAELCDRVAAASPRRVVTIAESDLNDPRVVTPTREGGWGFDAQWADDFHHALHARLTGERDGYYADFAAVADLAAATRRPFVYDGRYSSFRRRRHGAPAEALAPERFVVYSQNHDQVGNRAMGDRLPAAARPLAAMWVLLSPFTPMLFMGEEYGETRPFQFFTDHIDPFIADATRTGRRNEFKEFAGFADEVPDPQDAETFARSVLEPGAGDPALRALYRDLLALRARLPREHADVRFDEAEGWVAMVRGDVEVVGNFGTRTTEVQVEATRLVLATGGDVILAGDRLTLPPRAGAVVA